MMEQPRKLEFTGWAKWSLLDKNWWVADQSLPIYFLKPLSTGITNPVHVRVTIEPIANLKEQGGGGD